MNTKWNRINHQPCLPLGEDGKRISCSDKHIELSRKIAAEGIVLLKNENHLLPVNEKSINNKIVLLGKASEEYIKGGGGSGDVYTKYVRSIYDAFRIYDEKGIVSLFTKLHETYSTEIKKQHENGRVPGMTKEISLTEDQWKEAAEFSDTAVICLCRFSGEGWDRIANLNKEVHLEAMEINPWEAETETAKEGELIFQKGDFYLSNEEQEMIENAKKYFSHIIVLLNAGGMIDSSWFKNDKRIESVLYIGQGGMEGALAAADIFCGTKSPSGKLTDTFAKDLIDYPYTENFHDKKDSVEYTEDIFVGYRFFETIPGKNQLVNYPFGFGLSYTDFKIECCDEDFNEEDITLKLKVTNTGNYNGKEVVQIYYSQPENKISKPKLELAAFTKTPELKPGESVELIIKYKTDRMSFYDDEGIIQKSAWIMEKGEYKIYYGNSSRNLCKTTKNYELNSDKIICQCSQKLTPKKLSARLQSDGTLRKYEIQEYEKISRPPIFETPEKLEAVIPDTKKTKGGYIFDAWKNPQAKLLDVVENKISLKEFIDKLSAEELADLIGGQSGTGVANTFGIGNNSKHGIPNVMTADGPAGLRISPECEVCTTAWPCATTIASTWNTNLAYEYGNAVAKEVKENNIGIWLAPGMNIHRSPLCGRNFEYYSEDPLISGSMAAAVVRGVQENGIAATPKHFAFNNKETNRKHSDSILSERAAREIYLRGFEQVVKEADPWIIMSSYNIVNGTHTSESKELLTDILRKEWNYAGVVISDWWTRGEHWREAKAGNDVKMAAGYPEEILEALKNNLITIDELKTNAERILQMIIKLD